MKSRRTISTFISRHIKNIFDERELIAEGVVANIATTAADGKTYQVTHYNLDVIISVGYRVKSHRGTQFRIWATQRLKEYLVKGFALDDERLKRLGGGNYFDELLARIRDIRSSDLSNYKVVTIGQYAYNPSRINVGSIARLDGWAKGVLSPMYVVFKINEKKVTSDFFLHWLSSHEAKARIRRSAQGSVRETVSFTDLGAIPFPLPSLEQQQQIAEILNTARQEIDLLKKQAKAYRKQKRGLMQKMLTGEWQVSC